MIVLITGDFCVGKDLTADLLIEESLRRPDCEKFEKILSYTTRKPRYEGEKTHIFCPMEFYKDMSEDPINAGCIVAETKIHDDYYFTIENQFDKSKVNLYIVDNKGVEDVIAADIDDVYIIEVIRPIWLRDCPKDRLNRVRHNETYKFSSDYLILNDGDKEKLKGFVLACFDDIIKVKKSL